VPPSRRVWIFDLDNTLHDARARIFPSMHEQINAYLRRNFGVDEAGANAMRQDFWRRYGTTLRGLMRHHGTDPRRFLAETHVFPELAGMVVHENALKHALARLPGRKLIFTNADEPYARRVLEALGVGEHFADLHDIHAAELRPKPDEHGYRLLLDRFGIDPAHSAMIEDMAQNLKPAKKLGMTTVWVDNGSERGNHGHHPDFIDLTIADVGEWLDQMLGDEQ